MFNRQVLGLLGLLCWMAGTLAQQSCICANEAFKNACALHSVMEVGVGSGVVLRCLAGETLTQRMLAADLAADGNANFMALNTEVNNRYMSSGSTFQIMNLEAGDEGLYRCTGPDMMTFCVLAINDVEFESCPEMLDGSCVERVEVLSGQHPVTFNTRLRFDTSSVCKCEQNIDRLNFAYDDNRYMCFGNGTCRNVSGIFQQSGIPFNFSLTIPPLPPLPMEANMTEYEFVYIVVGNEPMSGNTDTYIKTFFVLILDPTPETSSSTESPTTNQLTGTTMNSGIDLVVGVTTAAVVLLALLVVIGSGLIVFAYCQYGRKHDFKRPSKTKNEEVIYSEIDDKNDKRGSKSYSSFRGPADPPELSPTLESVSVTA